MINRIGRLREQAKVKVNVGCGNAHQEGAINIDLHGSPDLCADARCLPIRSSSVDWLESHHLLEHFTLHEGKKVIEEWSRVIKPKGIMFITVPHILGMVKMMVGTQDIPEVWTGINMFIYGQDGPGMRHLSTYSPGFLTHRLKENKFDCEVIDWPYRPTPSFGVIACRQ